MNSEHSSKPPSSEDVLLIHDVTEDGRGFEVIRRRDDRLEAGRVRPLEANRPIHGEVLRLQPRPELPLLCDVKVEYSPPAAAGPKEAEATRPTSKGPAQVATARYRDNWDRIWSGRARSSDLPN